MVSLDGIVNEIKVFLLLFVDGFLEGTTRSGAKTHQWRHVLVLFRRVGHINGKYNAGCV